jgi:PTH1 family peptidyl-tRNA hydrolase
LKSIIQHLGSDQFPRLRIGVGAADAQGDLTGHVLGQFRREEEAAIAQAVNRAADAAELFLEQGVIAAMNRFNGPGDRDKLVE